MSLIVHLKALFHFIFILTLSTFLTTSCAFKKSRIVKQSFQNEKHTVSIIQKDKNDHYLSKKKLKHPYTFTEAEIFNNLVSLKYKRLALFSRSENIFERKTVTQISPLFAKAFNNAGKKDIIEFDIRSAKGRIAGNVFIFKGKLNWRFNIINGASYEKRNSRDYLDSWKLVLKKGQKYHGEKELFGVRVAKNWVVYPANQTWPDVTFEGENNNKITNSNKLDDMNGEKEKHGKNAFTEQDEIDAQFRHLKSLMKNGLISKEEYKAKKKELLEKYF